MTIAGTLPLAEAGGREWDVIVVGAGPAGAVTALELALLGARVLVVDKAHFPRRKVCGCCLNVRAMAALRAAGVEGRVRFAGAVPQNGLLLAAGRRRAELPLPGVVSLSRHRLDAELVESAVAAGAEFLPGVRARMADVDARFRSLHLASDEAGGETARARAGVVVAADGLGGALATEQLGGEWQARRSRIGVGAVIDAPPNAAWPRDRISMAIAGGGYAGLAYLEDGRLNVAAALDPEAVRKAGGPGPLVGAIFRGVGWAVTNEILEGPWQGTPRLTRRPRAVAAERLFALGDAAGYVEPFTGEGMAWALEGARALAPLALQAAREWQPALVEEWSHALRRNVQRRQLICRVTALMLRHTALTVAAVAALEWLPSLAAPWVSRVNMVRPVVPSGGGR